MPACNLAPGTTATVRANGRNRPTSSGDWDIVLGNDYAYYSGLYGEPDQGFSVRLSGGEGEEITITVPGGAIEATAWEARTQAGRSVTFGIQSKPR